VLDGGLREEEPPSGLIGPEVMEWIAQDDSRISQHSSIILPDEVTSGRVRVRVPHDSVVRISLLAEGVS